MSERSSGSTSTTSGSAEVPSRTPWRRRRSTQLEDQVWYHGCILREDARLLLLEDGQFLVRASAKKGELNLVISVRQNTVQHFILGWDDHAGGWRLEGRAFPTIYELIHYYCTTKTPLTKESGAIIRVGVKKQKWELDDRDIEMNRKLGSGQSGTVFAGTWRTAAGRKTVAIKQCTHSLKQTDDEKAKFLQAAKETLKYKHKNIVIVHGVAADRPPVKIVMEFCPGGDLATFLKKNRGQTTLDDKMRYCAEAVAGMKYLARKGCIHRDLAARNCLLGEHGQLKISDFGMSRQQKEYKVRNRAEQRVPVRWTAPEAIKLGVFSTMSDVWSYGVLMWEIFSGQVRSVVVWFFIQVMFAVSEGEIPWADISDSKEVYKRIVKGERMPDPEGTPTIFGALMKKCWDKDPRERPSFGELAVSIKIPRRRPRRR